MCHRPLIQAQIFSKYLFCFLQHVFRNTFCCVCVCVCMCVSVWVFLFMFKCLVWQQITNDITDPSPSLILNDELLIAQTFERNYDNTIVQQLPKYSNTAIQSLTNTQWRFWVCRQHGSLGIQFGLEKNEWLLQSMNLNIVFRVCGDNNETIHNIPFIAMRIDGNKTYFSVDIIPIHNINDLQYMKVECWMAVKRVNDFLPQKFYQITQFQRWFLYYFFFVFFFLYFFG